MTAGCSPIIFPVLAPTSLSLKTTPRDDMLVVGDWDFGVGKCKSLICLKHSFPSTGAGLASVMSVVQDGLNLS